MAETETPSEVSADPLSSDNNSSTAELAAPYVGRWNRLVSTTNWEKGRIICQWRQALIDAEAPVSEYSDEAWATRVGGVSSQHVGRLRRVFQRFGETHEQFAGLFWSHFQAGLDWDDAEMWLEGAVQNDWSVSQMRGKRWETVGEPGQPMPDEPLAEEGGSSSTSAAEDDSNSEAAGRVQTVTAQAAKVKDLDADTEETAETDESGPAESDSVAVAEAETSRAAPQRLAVEVEELPDDLADAFEQFKLAIIAHRRDGWVDTTPEIVVECLEALRELTLQEA